MSYLLLQSDARRIPLRSGSVHCVVTSPPYWGLRSYGVDAQIGLESTPEDYVCELVAVFREVWRVLRNDGTVWLNLGDTYNSSPSNQQNGWFAESPYQEHAHRSQGRQRRDCPGLKPKDLCLIPERVALALQAAGWHVRAKPPWIKPSSMPESVQDRPSVAHESIFLLAKSQDYYYDQDATRSPLADSSLRQIAHSEQHSFNGDGRSKMAPDRGHGDKSCGAGGQHASAARGANMNPAGRNRRTSDWFHESLDDLIAHHEAYAAHLRGVRDRGGMLASEDGEPLAFRVTAQGFKGAHFAVFPGRLIAPMIRASTSEAGCCPACGKPWERVTERETNGPSTRKGRILAGSRLYEGQNQMDPYGDGGIPTGRCGGSDTRGLPSVTVETLGWRPTCPCNASPPVPCVVLDPFAGAATSLVVATALGRHAIGCDLNPDYLRMGQRRLERPHAPVERPATGEVLPLFAGMEQALLDVVSPNGAEREVGRG